MDDNGESPTDVVKHLSVRSIETFRPLSELWHRFLGLTPGPAGERGSGSLRTARGKRERSRAGDELLPSRQKQLARPSPRLL